MGRERQAVRERREAHYKIRNDTCERKPLSATELNQLFIAVDKKDGTPFGIRKLATVQLDGLQAPPPSKHLATPAEAAALMEAPTVTVLSYAAWRRRDQVVKSLLIAGADPTVCEARPGGAQIRAEVIRALRMMPSSTAVFLVEQIVRLRSVTNRAARRGWRAEPCACCGSDEQVLYCEPCGHSCCEPCMWRALCDSAESDEGAEITLEPDPHPHPYPHPHPHPHTTATATATATVHATVDATATATLTRRGHRVPRLRWPRHAAATAGRLERPGPAARQPGDGGGERAALQGGRLALPGLGQWERVGVRVVRLPQLQPAATLPLLRLLPPAARECPRQGRSAARRGGGGGG